MLSRALLAFTVTLAVCPLTIAVLRRSAVVDSPNDRSSHDIPTPRGAGIAVAVGALIAASVSPALSTWRTPLILASGSFALLGVLEDVRGVPTLRRLTAQVLLAALMLPLLLRALTGPGPWRLVFGCGVLLWLVAHVNAFNFMDGINGISAIQVGVAGASWWAIGSAERVTALAYGGAIIVGAVAGFAPYNFPRAMAFLGDVGSYFLGAWLAVLVVIGLRAGLPPEAVLAPVAVGLVDTLWTLLGRLRRGEVWYEPHREHIYQRLVRAGWSHTRTTLFVGSVLAACSTLGATTLATRTLPARVAADLVTAAVLSLYVVSPLFAADRAGGRPAAAA